MSDNPIPRAALALAAAAALAAAGCERAGGEGLDPTPFHGGWFPCVDETCETVGEDGIGFGEGGWFFRLGGDEGAPPEEIDYIDVDEREWSWSTEGDRVVIDFGDVWQELWVRFEGEGLLQIERLTNTSFNDDTEVADMETTECVEGEKFDLPSDDPEDWPSDLWTPDKCWTEAWAPVGRAVRVMSPGELLVLGYEAPIREEPEKDEESAEGEEGE